jgi:hypothetical protein
MHYTDRRAVATAYALIIYIQYIGIGASNIRISV